MPKKRKAAKAARVYSDQELAENRTQLAMYTEMTLKAMQAARTAKRGPAEDRKTLMTIMRHFVRRTNSARTLLTVVFSTMR
jgi:hypothetical protein